MTKKLLALLTALMLLLSGVAVADGNQAGSAPAAIKLTVQDAQGNDLPGMQVELIGQMSNEVILSFMTGDTDVKSDNPQLRCTTNDGKTYDLSGIPTGVWYVRATDPADGYSDNKLIDASYTDGINLVIRKLQPGSTVKVASVTPLMGEFATGLWGNNTTDLDIRAMLFDGTVSWTGYMQYLPNYSLISSIEATSNLGGDKTYYITLKDDLKFSDGQPITAKDFVFAILAVTSPELERVGAAGTSYSMLTGYADYAAGKTQAFKGVHLTGENSFTLTIDRSYLPFYYELTYVNVVPLPMHVIAAGCDVVDTEKGATLTGSFDVKALRDYDNNPTVSNGPYTLVSFDQQTRQADMKVNPYYAGNYEGRKPVIENVSMCLTDYDTALEDVKNGKLDILNKLSRNDVVTAAQEMAQDGTVSVTDYMRDGQAYLALACEDPVMANEAIRQAIACCVDKDALVAAYLGDNGERVDSYYGLGQWMNVSFGLLRPNSKLENYLRTYPLDANRATQLVIRDGWNRGADGEKWKGGVRYKMLNGKVIPLQIRFAKIKDNKAAQWIVDNVAPVLESIGFEFVVEEMSYEQVLRQLYRQTERTCNMMFIASNFNVVFDPYFTFNVADEFQGVSNHSGIRDQKLQDFAWKMRSAKPGDTDAYVSAWLDFLRRFSEVLPNIPLYTNVYHDVAASRIQGYAPNAAWSWAYAILYTWVDEPAAAEATK